MNAVIYARFSSHSQREESIEGQLKVCYEYAKANGYAVISEYVDRAKSGTSICGRTELHHLVEDSKKGCFEVVLVYQLDRLARSRYDSAVIKNKLQKNDVRVVSAKENIADDPSGIILEGMLETLAEYYSADLAQKIMRGQRTNAEHHKYNGGAVPMGYRIVDQCYTIDENAAPVVRKIFDLYADGMQVKDIVEELNQAGIMTQKGKPFAPNSLQKILRNKRYTGTYIYGDTEITNGIPRIISDDTFTAVQRLIDVKKRAPSLSGRFLLTTKLFCGYCGHMLVGDSGTSRHGQTHYYYACKGAKKKQCNKKAVKKDYIEKIVVDECRKILTDENIALIAKRVSALNEKEGNSSYLKALQKEMKTTQTAIENLMNALEQGEEADLILGRIKTNRIKQQDLEVQIAKEELTNVVLTETEIEFFLKGLRSGYADDDKYSKMLINVLVNKVVLYDDRLTIFFSAADGQVEITAEMQEEVVNGGVRMGETVLHHILQNRRLSAVFCFPTHASAPNATSELLH